MVVRWWIDVKNAGFGEVLEARVLAEEGEADRADGTVALLADDDLGRPLVLRVLVVDLVAVDEEDHVCVLFNRPDFAKIRHHRPLVRPLLERAVELRQRHHRNLELLGQRLHRARDLGDLGRAVLALRRRLHELQIVDDDEAELAVLLVQAARARAHLDRIQRGVSSIRIGASVSRPSARRQLLPVLGLQAPGAQACAGRAGRPSRSCASRAATRPFPSRTRRPAA